MRFFFTTAVFTLLSHLALAQMRVLDSLQAVLQQHITNDTVRVNLLNNLSEQYKWIDFTRAQKYAEQARTLALSLHFDRGVALADCRMAHAYWALGENGWAVEKGLEAADIAEKNHFKTILGETYQVLSRPYMDQRELKKAESYIRMAEKIALETNNWDLLSRVYNFWGVIQYVQNNVGNALAYYTKALNIIQEHPTSRAHLSQVTSNIGECYKDSNPELAFKYFNEALAISKNDLTRNKSAEASISSIIGRALVKRGRYQEAEQYLLASLKLSREMGLKRNIRHTYSGLVSLKIEEGKAADALVYLKKYYEVHDSLMNVAKTRQIVELETKHQLEKKELTIQLLERDKRIQQIWTSILIAALMLIALGSVGIYNLLLFREKKNREILNLQIDKLTAQNKEVAKKFNSTLTVMDEAPVESADQRLLKEAIEVVEKNLANASFSVEQMAREMGMSRTNMHRKLKSITGVPPGDLIRNIRLRKAASLLLHQADSVAQISFQVGFEDHSYFSKSFKKQFGVPPSEYFDFVKQSQN
jgi:AraC-like DNA-binding protein